jgi:hypothetical protein
MPISWRTHAYLGNSILYCRDLASKSFQTSSAINYLPLQKTVCCMFQ